MAITDDEDLEQQPDDEGAEGESPEQPGPAPSEGEGGEAQPGQKAPPQLQAQYDQFVNQGYHLIYNGGRANPAVLKMLGAGDPVHGLAAASVEIIMRLLTDLAGKGIKPNGGVIFHGGKEIFQDLADLSAKAGIHKFNDAEISQAWMQAMDLARVRMQKAGMIDPATFQRNVEEMKKAEAEGKIDEILPGLGPVLDKVKQGQQQGGGEQPAPAGPDDEDQQQGGLLG